MSDTDTWHLSEGDLITPELTVLRRLGGGFACEVFLAFDEVTYVPVVVKVVRPRPGGRREHPARSAA